jgi:hypothetical protein
VSCIVAPGCPFGRPGFRPDVPRSDFGAGFASPSDGGGLATAGFVAGARERVSPPHRAHRDIAAAVFRAVQSTPLIERNGCLLGVVSTRYPRPYCPSRRQDGRLTGPRGAGGGDAARAVRLGVTGA